MKIKLIGMLILVGVIVMSVIWYDWKLAILIYAGLLGNNLERRKI